MHALLHRLGALGASLYSAWTLSLAAMTAVGVALRSPIVRAVRRLLAAIHNAKALLAQNDKLVSDLAQERTDKKDLSDRFASIRARYDELKQEIVALGEDLVAAERKIREAERNEHERDQYIQTMCEQLAAQADELATHRDQIASQRQAADALAHQLSVANEQVTTLTQDCEDLVAWGGMLVAQLVAAGVPPSNTMPTLRKGAAPPAIAAP